MINKTPKISDIVYMLVIICEQEKLRKFTHRNISYDDDNTGAYKHMYKHLHYIPFNKTVVVLDVCLVVRLRPYCVSSI